jgi:hypothetical protein
VELKTFFAQDLQGNVIPNPTVTLYLPGTTTLASGLQNSAGASLSNPFTGGSTGQIVLAAPDGDYDMKVAGGGRELVMRVRFNSASDTALSAAAAAAASAGEALASAGVAEAARDAAVAAHLDAAAYAEAAADSAAAAAESALQAGELTADAVAGSAAVAADAGSYSDKFLAAESRTKQTANSSGGGSYSVTSVAGGGFDLVNSSTSGYRQVASLFTRKAGAISRYKVTWKAEEIKGQNGRAGLAIGPAVQDSASARLYIYRGDGRVYSIDGAINNATIYLSTDASREYVQGDTVSMELSVDAAGNGTITVTNPSGTTFSASVGAVPDGIVWAMASTYGTTRFYGIESSTIGAVAEQVVSTSADVTSLRSDLTALSNLVAAVIPPSAKVPMPDQWASPNLPLVSIYRMAGGVYAAAFNPDLYRPFANSAADATIYVDPVSGNDANDGTSASPKQSLAAAVATAVDNLRVVAKGGVYVGSLGFDGATITASRLIVESWDGAPVVSSRVVSGVSWTHVGNNVYTATVANAGCVVDASNPAPNGMPDWLYPRTSQADVEATPGTYWIDGSTVYVHTFDSRAPDADIIVYDTQPNFIYSVNGGIAWMSDIHCYGGDSPLRMRYAVQARAGTFYLTRCSGNYGCSSTSGVGNGVQIDGKWSGVLVECSAALNLRDGFNYKGVGFVVPNIVEIGCNGSDNGREGADHGSGSHNGSTMHDAGTIVRINGTYLRNLRNIHDVSDPVVATNNGYFTHSWNLGCVAGYSRGSTGSPDNANGFRIGHPADPDDESLMWLYGCSNHAPGYDRSTAGSGATIYSLDFTGSAAGDQLGSNVVEI